MRVPKWLGLSLMLLWVKVAIAAVYPMPPVGEDLIGDLQYVTSQSGDTLGSISVAHEMILREVRDANPALPVKGPLPVGTVVVIPSLYILPPIRNGVVINLAELRVYYFNEANHTVGIFPIGAGRKGWNTPTSNTSIIRKEEDPTWTPPASICRHYKKKGIILPQSIPPGPANPLGKYALRLALSGYLIHGTNTPSSVGYRSSSGCIRMLPEGIKYLYENVPVNTPVHIIHVQDKIGFRNGELYLEAEAPFNEYEDEDAVLGMIDRDTKDRQVDINWERVSEVREADSGVPEVIGKDVSHWGH